MQILTTSILLLISLFLAETTAFARSYLKNDIFLDSSRGILPERTIFFRDLAATIKRTMAEIKSSSTDVVVPLKSTGENKKRGNTVQIGTGQTSQILAAPVQEPDEVGFHVALSHTKYMGPHDVELPFDQILEAVPEQVNGFYDPATGVFTSPVSGTYLVSLTIANAKKNVIYANVLVNGSKRKLSVVSDGLSGIAQGSVTGIVKLEAKETLSVGINEPMHADVHGNNLSSWSVYLLKKH